MVKAVLFDYGGVITHCGKPGTLSNNLAVNLAIPSEHAMTLLEYGFDKIQRGLISEEEFWSIPDATALSNDAELWTHNLDDFKHSTGLRTFDPVAEAK